MPEEKKQDTEDPKAAEEQKVKAQELQQKYMEYQMVQQQIKQLQQNLEKLEEQKKEAEAVEQGLTDFNASEKGSEVLVPLSGGIFFKTRLKDSDRFLVNVGANIVVEKDLDGVKGLVKKQKEDIGKYHNAMMTEFTKVAIRNDSLEKELKELVED